MDPDRENENDVTSSDVSGDVSGTRLSFSRNLLRSLLIQLSRERARSQRLERNRDSLANQLRQSESLLSDLSDQASILGAMLHRQRQLTCASSQAPPGSSRSMDELSHIESPTNYQSSSSKVAESRTSEDMQHLVDSRFFFRDVSSSPISQSQEGGSVVNYHASRFLSEPLPGSPVQPVSPGRLEDTSMSIESVTLKEYLIQSHDGGTLSNFDQRTAVLIPKLNLSALFCGDDVEQDICRSRDPF